MITTISKRSHWLAGQRPSIEEFLSSESEPVRSALLRGLLEIELEHRVEAVETPARSEYLSRFSDYPELVADVFERRAVAGKGRDDGTRPNTDSRRDGPDMASGTAPVRIGRHQVIRELGTGSFGTVYLAYDEQLKRQVAIKVPRRGRISGPVDVGTYLSEARVVASLDHPHIVPVYDVGQTTEGHCYIITKYIAGRNLSDVISQERPSHVESAELMAMVARALHDAHTRGVIHRDVKPSNILIDTDGKPFLVDFGLALKDEQYGEENRYVGAPAYMSPEQARGEGHLVDGRSDVFSLGIVLYELLTGVRPFRGADRRRVIENVKTTEARPPRQIDDTICIDLERICLKALSKRASDRYTTALDMADDLQQFVSESRAEENRANASATSPRPGDRASDPCAKIVPKGLRSFDDNDADFFLELLPGPRDRDGLPESVRFWKSRIEQTEPDRTFRVGVIYGPSGCGKSSLVKAGLLPRLASHVQIAYLEATPENTETQLRRALQKHGPRFGGDIRLPDLVATIRGGREGRRKILIVLDQFEQWLHARAEDMYADLVQALRHCDGGHVQCVLMVRDDFWMALTRFMRQLEIRLVEGENSAAVDLFDSLHARHVLTEFGRAYGRLPGSPSELTKNQMSFLESAVSGLAEDGRVVPVRLSLFAQMLKGRPWRPATLTSLGGMEGIGLMYLEETFCSKAAPPKYRLHEKTARAVLGSLLPASGVDIKTAIRSRESLLQAFGNADYGHDFNELMHILESEARLVAPIDYPVIRRDRSAQSAESPKRHYQLTHDYLVPSIREWLARKQKETRRGRAELLLAERAHLWQAQRANRYLPAWWEFFRIRCLVRKQNWTKPQQAMMYKAAHYHARRGLLILLTLLAVAVAGWGILSPWQKANHAEGLVQRLLDARISEVPEIVSELEPYRNWTNPVFEQTFLTSPDPGHRLRAGLALLAADNESVVGDLLKRMLEAGSEEFPVVRDSLESHKEALIDKLWATVEDEQLHWDQRFRAACALATYVPRETSRWEKASADVAERLVSVSPVFVDHWIAALRPIRHHLLPTLQTIFRDPRRSELERFLAAQVLADYVSGRVGALTDLLVDSDTKQFAVLLGSLERSAERDDAITQLQAVVQGFDPATEQNGDRHAEQRANAAAALLRIDPFNEVAWSLMRQAADPRARTYLIHQLSPCRVDVNVLAERLEACEDSSTRAALILSLGEFPSEQLPPESKQKLIESLRQTYRNDTDRAIHAAAEWLLRRWGQDREITHIDQELATGRVEGDRQWYIDGQRHTMVILDADTFQMGSPKSENYRLLPETQHTRYIGREFAIASKEVTRLQFERFLKETPVHLDFSHEFSPLLEGPQCSVTWHLAARYCNWLSEREGIPKDHWCYQHDESDETGEGMTLVGGYLLRTGYRLPTEAEWEFACRGGTVTSRYYGDTDELLSRYAWYDDNSGQRAHRVGQLKPNDFGLFDMHGNVWEWTDNGYYDYPEHGEIVGDDIATPDNGVVRVRILRGGAWASPVKVVRAAHRYVSVISTPNASHGFRVARTSRP